MMQPYGLPSAATRGREHPTEPDPGRNEIQRDRDRIVHSRAFRRLQYKTQVFTNDEGDHFRTRLTHTIEVAGLARAAARRLGLNEDLVECVALVHDIGHPPFGHRGEDLLDGLMKDHGGFEHNAQGLRIVERLEQRYPEHPGLNLTYEVRESIVKHSARFDPGRVPTRFHPEEQPLLEAQLVDQIDAVAYDCHDIDDGIRAGLIGREGLMEVPLWAGAWAEAVEASPRGTAEKLLIDRALRRLMAALVNDLVATTQGRIAAAGVDAVAAVRRQPDQLVEFGRSTREAKEELEAWLFRHLYRHWRVNQTFHAARKVLADLFAFFTTNPDTIPTDFAARIDGDGLHRVVADYLAGMTDRFALDEHRRLCR
jgi:dGTPase